MACEVVSDGPSAHAQATGMLVVGGLYGEYYPSGFAAGCAFAPTSIDKLDELLDESKMLNSLVGMGAR